MPKCAGILPLFENGKTVLLGKEYRLRFDEMVWMEFGGKQDPNETLAETACREFNEETAFVFHLKVDKVIEAEKNGWYIDYHNPKTNNFYRMYILIFSEQPSIKVFKENSMFYLDLVEKLEWQYFPTKDIVYSNIIPIYETCRIRLNLLKETDFFKNLNLSE